MSDDDMVGEVNEEETKEGEEAVEDMPDTGEEEEETF